MRMVSSTGVPLPYDCEISINGQHRFKQGWIHPEGNNLRWKVRRVAIAQKKTA
jgi:hypothetical protein